MRGRRDVVRSSNSAGMDSRIKLRFSADEVATFSKAPIFDRKNAGCSCMKDFSVARGSNNGVTNNRAKFRFPGDKTFPWLMMQTTGGWTSRASLPLPSRQEATPKYEHRIRRMHSEDVCTVVSRERRQCAMLVEGTMLVTGVCREPSRRCIYSFTSLDLIVSGRTS